MPVRARLASRAELVFRALVACGNIEASVKMVKIVFFFPKVVFMLKSDLKKSYT